MNFLFPVEGVRFGCAAALRSENRRTVIFDEPACQYAVSGYNKLKSGGYIEGVVKIILASDHRGLSVQEIILEYLQTLPGYSVMLINGCSTGDADYPDIAAKVARSVASGEADRGILICGTGIGTCVVANKFPGVRAAPCHNEVIAELSRKHNNANILCLSGDLLGERSSVAITAIWLATPFEGGRHSVRLEKIRQFEMANYTHNS